MRSLRSSGIRGGRRRCSLLLGEGAAAGKSEAGGGEDATAGLFTGKGGK